MNGRKSNGIVSVKNSQAIQQMRESLQDFKVSGPTHSRSRSLQQQSVMQVLKRTIPEVCAKKIIRHEGLLNDKMKKRVLEKKKPKRYLNLGEKEPIFHDNPNGKTETYSPRKQNENNACESLLEEPDLKMAALKQDINKIIHQVQRDREMRKTTSNFRVQQFQQQKFQKYWNCLPRVTKPNFYPRKSATTHKSRKEGPLKVTFQNKLSEMR